MRIQKRQLGVTLVELAVAITIGSVVLLIAWASWEVCWRQTAAASNAGACQRNAFGALERISQEIMRAETILVPDPEFPNAPSIQLRIPNGDDGLRRAFRLLNGALIVDLKDENVDPYEAFTGLSDLSFTLLDSPTNSRVRIACTASFRGQSIQMRTVAVRRN